MSDAARHAAFYVPETIYGTTPTTPAFKAIRHTGMTLGVQRSSLQSQEIRPDRQIADFRLGTNSVAGDISTELSFASFDDFLQAVFMGTWTPKATVTDSTLSVAAADSSFNDTANGFVTAGFAVGDLITTSNFTNTANNGVFLIATVAAGKITVTKPDTTAAALTVEAAGAPRTVVTKETQLKAGTTRRSFSVLRQFTDIAATGNGMPYHLFNGVELNTMALAIKPTAIVTATFGTVGRQGVAPSNTAPVGSTFGTATTTAPLDAFTGAMTMDGTTVADVTEFSISLENGLAVRDTIGTKFTSLPTAGNSNLVGSATVYFEDATFLTKFLNETPAALSVTIPDGAGNSYVFTAPRVKFTGGQPDVKGAGAITLSMPFQGTLDPVTGTNIMVRRIPSATQS